MCHFRQIEKVIPSFFWEMYNPYITEKKHKECNFSRQKDFTVYLYYKFKNILFVWNQYDEAFNYLFNSSYCICIVNPLRK